MVRRRRARRLQAGSHPGAPGCEWIGGRIAPPFFIEDRDEPYRPALVVWAEHPSGLVVGADVFAPEETEGTMGRVLRRALEEPLAGPPRRPERIRVADASLAAEVRETVGDAIPVVVEPTPELEDLLQSMIESMGPGDAEPSYLEGGRVSPEAVERLFAAARLLFTVKPWEATHDVLRMDIPALGVEGACLSIIGALGESLGVLVFPSLEGYKAFLRAGEGPRPQGPRIDLGTDWLALSFDRAEDLPLSMRREVEAHGWPVAGPDAYPSVQRRERDGAVRPLVEGDLEIAAACASSLSAFFVKHERLFQAEDIELVCESYFDEDDLEVRFTLPYEAFPLFDVSTPERRPDAAAGGRPRVGRNRPCPCGSGLKYKKCCLAKDEASAGTRDSRPQDSAAALHDRDAYWVRELLRYAADRFELEPGDDALPFRDEKSALQLSVPWLAYMFAVRGRSVLEWYLKERGRRLSRADRDWLESQRAAWLSVWEVIEVEPGETVTLRDLLSHEVRRVRERSGSRTLVVRDAILARVVDFEDVSILCDSHPRPLPPMDAAAVVERARGRLRRRGAVPVERLRDGGFGSYLIRRWEDAVSGLDEHASRPTKLQNTDGEPFVLTTDHFDVAPGARAEVEARLAALPGVEPPEPDEESAEYVFMRPGNHMHKSWDNTVIGRAWLSGGVLRVETNSRERADRLREQIEAACGSRIRHRSREHADPLSSRSGLGESSRQPEPEVPPEAEQLLLDFKRRHYADWPDSPLPALGGKTPREMTRTAQGRAAVDLLLKDMENHEQRTAGAAAFDFSALRRELGLE